MEVAPGEIFGLIGPDGAGKTTTFQILAGVMEATSGVAEVFSRPARETRSQTGYLTQTFSLYPDLSVSENIRYIGDLRRVPAEEIELRATKISADVRHGPVFAPARGQAERRDETKTVARLPRWCRNRTCFFSTNPPPESIRYRVVNSGMPWRTWRPMASPFWWPRRIWTRRSAAIVSRSCTWAKLRQIGTPVGTSLDSAHEAARNFARRI